MSQVNLIGNYMYSLIGLFLWFDATSASIAVRGDGLGVNWECCGSVKGKIINNVDE